MRIAARCLECRVPFTWSDPNPPPQCQRCFLRAIGIYENEIDEHLKRWRRDAYRLGGHL